MPKQGATTRRRLGEILVAGGVITTEQLEEALGAQATASDRARLGTIVVRLGLAQEDDIARALAEQLRLDLVDLAHTAADPVAVARVPRQIASRHMTLPLQIDGDTLVVAIADPTNVVARDDLKFVARVGSVRMLVATESAVREALRHAYGADQSALDALREEDIEPIDDDQHDGQDVGEGASADDQPIVKLANLILAEAVHARASDVHVEPGRTGVRIRYRVDGLLRDIMRVPREASAALGSRLKIMARLDIAERRRPQDGRALVRVEGQEVDLRVSTLPTLFGETVVLRLLRKGDEQIALTDVGMAPDHLDLFRSVLDRPQGLVVITGPTGSGKTSTLYAGLQEIADPVRNIVTLEDPVEYQLDGVNQTQINDKVGLTFARGLRSILRQDPDVVLVGEIRDGETAQLAIQASMTGHLVLSTLHTNDAPSTVLRLVDLGIEPFLLGSSLLLVIAQRLIRRVCEHCAGPVEPDDAVLASLGLTRSDLAGATLVAGRGCELCGRTGYRGREAVYEMLPITSGLKDLLRDGATEGQIARLARAEGMRSLREEGIRKALAGATTLEEVLRVTPAELTVRTGGPGPAPAEAPSAPPPVPHPALPTPSAAALTAAPADTTLPLLLVVDDDPSIRRVVAAQLADDYEVVSVADGESALAVATERQPDAILLDLSLPDLDGLEVARRLRQQEATRWIPVLVITGSAAPESEVESLLAGVDDYVRKPFDDEILRSRIVAARRAYARV